MNSILLAILLLVLAIPSQTIFSADDQLGYPSYKPKEPPQPADYDNAYNSWFISEQLLKDEIRAATIPVIRERMRAARAAVGPHQNGRACRVASFQFNRIFYATAQDLLSRSIFEKIHALESKPGFRDKAMVRNTLTRYSVECATPKEIDRYTRYAWASDNDRSSATCTVLISDFQFIERVIADVTQEDGIEEHAADNKSSLFGSLCSII